MVTPATAPPAIYVSFSAGINLVSAQGLISAMAACASQGAREVHLLFSTDGGGVMYGINVYNVLRSMPFTLVTHNVGNVDSIGSAIFLAGERRYACPHSTFMFHGVHWGFQGPGSLSAMQLRETVASVEADETRISSIIDERTNLSEGEARTFFRDAHTMNATDALGAGIVHEVRDVEVPPGSQVLALSF
jgi:ATP-dependent protease ClpP protease subunit